MKAFVCALAAPQAKHNKSAQAARDHRRLAEAIASFSVFVSRYFIIFSVFHSQSGC